MHLIDRQTVTIAALPTRLHLGVSEGERARPQEIRVSVAITLFDPKDFREHDRLDDTIDYDEVIRFVRDGLPLMGEVRLIETVADHVAAHALGLSIRIASVEVTVEKPAVLGLAGAVRVSILRHADRQTHRQAMFLAEEAHRR